MQNKRIGESIQQAQDKNIQAVQSGNKFSYFQMVQSNKIGQAEIKAFKVPKNSFYVQRFKRNKNSIQERNQSQQRSETPRSTTFRKAQANSMGVMVPFFVNNKPSTRHVSRSLAANQSDNIRRNISENISPQKNQILNNGKLSFRQISHRNMNKKYSSENAYDSMMVGMNQYFSIMKLPTYKRNENKVNKVANERKQIRSENKMREEDKYWYLNNEHNFKIQRITPNTSNESRQNSRQISMRKTIEVEEQCDRNDRIQKLVTQEIVPLDNPNPRALIKYKSSYYKEPMQKLRKSSSPIQKDRKSSTQKKNIFLADYFGKVKDNFSVQELQRLKGLYYKDVIWKIWFNSGWKVKIQSYGNAIDSPRFFVGRGNNSKLVRSIMAKRWWWKLQMKEENANFLWTQLKIYSAYQLQVQYPKIQQFESEDTVNEQKLIENDICLNEISRIDQIYSQTRKVVNTLQLNVNQKQQDIIYDEEWWNYRKTIADKNTYLLTYKKYLKWQTYLKNINNLKRQARSTENLENRKVIEKSMEIKQKYPQKVTNHLQYSRLIGNKKALYKTMSMYYELAKKQNKFLPQTYHITSGLQDQEYLKFLSQYYRKSKQENNSMWIVKPGEMSNRGCGIKVCKDIQDIKNILKNKKVHNNGKPFTYIIQQYLRQPFLYQGRKFDIRHYVMINSNFGRIKGYFYEEGYIRTTSYKYSNKNHDSYVHLTNDAVQKYCKDYGKYEKGNKVSYEDFQKYLKSLPGAQEKGHSFYENILPKIRQISIDIINASYYLIDPNRKGNNFEIFGLDIMIDSNFKPWLIEVNTNPCLELSSPVLAKIIPKMLDNAFSISLDPLFPPPSDISIASKKNNLPQNYINHNKFQLVFDEIVEGKKLNTLYNKTKDQLSQMQGYGSDQQAYESAQDQCDADL